LHFHQKNNRAVIEVKGVHKSFKQVHAVQGINLKIREGEFVALLGPNGAGKTTLVEMIEGIQQPDEGEIRILDRHWEGHADELHRLIGLSLQETRFIDRLRVWETLRLFADPLAYEKPPKAMAIPHNTVLGRKRDVTAKRPFGPLVIYDPMHNTLKSIRPPVDWTDPDALAAYHAAASGAAAPDAEGEDVFKALGQDVLALHGLGEDKQGEASRHFR
jgi:hypothetical protein